jgi:hypothetical protein
MGEMDIYPKNVMCTLNKTGDSKLIWDPKNKDEVKAAEDQFDTLTGKGFMAYEVLKSGDKNENKQMKKFNKRAGRIILVPPMVGG